MNSIMAGEGKAVKPSEQRKIDIFDCFESPLSSTDLSHMTKTDAVVAYLREAIITSRLQPGDRIGQLELAEQLNISPTPVREALRKLEAQGILNYLPHHGVQVAIPTRQVIDEIYKVRAFLEGLAVEHTVQNIDADTLECLNELARNLLPQLLEESLGNGIFTPWKIANYNLHRSIYASSRLATIPEMIDNLWARSVAPDELFVFDSTRVQDAAQEHVQILDAMNKGDGNLARRLIQEHVELTRTSYLKFLSLKKVSTQ